MVHYVNPADPLQSLTQGFKLATATPVLWVICSHRLIKILIKKSSKAMKSTSQVSSLGSLSLLLAHLSTLCSKSLKICLSHRLSLICYIQGFSRILSWQNLFCCSFDNEIFHKFRLQMLYFPLYLYILVALWVAVGRFRGQHPSFWKKTAVLT